MNESNGSSLRVSPVLATVLNTLVDEKPFGDPWLPALWDMAARSRPGHAAGRPASLGDPVAVEFGDPVADKPADLGDLVAEETPESHAHRVGKVFGRAVAPPVAFLRWMLMNPPALDVRDPVGFGAKSDEARRWRGKLFSGDAIRVTEAQEEGLKLLGQRLAQRGRNKWWAFEGFSRVDACFITDHAVVFIDATGPETLAPSTLWFPNRSRIWRHLEAAKELAGEKNFGVILAVNSTEEGSAALAGAAASLEASLPHLDAADRADLSRHLLGFVVWSEVTSRLGRPVV